MPYVSLNPYDQQIYKKYPYLTNSELDSKLKLAGRAWKNWSSKSIDYRLEVIRKTSKNLQENLRYHAALITSEMGKPIRESVAEIEKSIWLCDYYAGFAEKLLQDENFSDSNHPSIVYYEPTGVIFAIMPWNFPYWQVFRFLIPNLSLGNGALLKHASNVPQCAEAIEQLLLDSGLPEGVFQNLYIDYKQVEQVIRNNCVSGVTVTGSETAGASVAELAGKYIKKSVLELGGSDPFIVLEDVDVANAVNNGILSRMRNAGQSCIAAKRFIIHCKIYDEFMDGFCKKAMGLKLGDPMSELTDMGPLAREILLTDLSKQVKSSVVKGANIICGGKKVEIGKLFYEPTIVTDISKGMALYDQEIFGPVASVFKFSALEDALELSNDTEFGLGASIWTKDIDKARHIARHINSGIVSINGLVASEPHLPFGGIKKSGYGRELSVIGLKEFSNIKTVNIF